MTTREDRQRSKNFQDCMKILINNTKDIFTSGSYLELPENDKKFINTLITSSCSNEHVLIKE